MDYGDDYDFSDWFSDDYGSDYTPMEGNTTPDSGDSLIMPVVHMVIGHKVIMIIPMVIHQIMEMTITII